MRCSDVLNSNLLLVFPYKSIESESGLDYCNSGIVVVEVIKILRCMA